MAIFKKRVPPASNNIAYGLEHVGSFIIGAKRGIAQATTGGKQRGQALNVDGGRLIYT